MCTFQDERTVTVCDIAIDRVRRAVDEAFRGKVRYTHIEGQGTLVQADADVDADQFSRQARSAISAAQQSE